MKKIIIFILLLFTPTVYAQDLLFNQRVPMTIDMGLKQKLLAISGETLPATTIISGNEGSLAFLSNLGAAGYLVENERVVPAIGGYNAFGFTNKLSKTELVIPKFLGKYSLFYLMFSNSENSTYEYLLVYTKPLYKVSCNEDNHCTVSMEIEGTNFGLMIEGLSLIQSMTFNVVSDEYQVNNFKAVGCYISSIDKNHITLNVMGNQGYFNEETVNFMINLYNNVDVTYARIKNDFDMKSINYDLPETVDYTNIEYDNEPKNIKLDLILKAIFMESMDDIPEQYHNDISVMINTSDSPRSINYDGFNYYKMNFPLVEFDITPKENDGLGGIVSLDNLSVNLNADGNTSNPLLVTVDAESMPFNNKVEVIPEVKGVEENPKTGLFNTLLLIAPIILLVYGSYKLYKLRLFKKM